MAKGANSPQRPRYWLLTSPRTASNLLVKMLNLGEQNVRPAIHGGYFFLPSLPKHFLIAEKPMDTWTEEDSATVNKVILMLRHRATSAASFSIWVPKCNVLNGLQIMMELVSILQFRACLNDKIPTHHLRLLMLLPSIRDGRKNLASRSGAST